jgi:dephospho-CoA kinase
MSDDNLLIGLTGGIGSGKSRVAELFTAYGALVVDADQIARFILEPGEKGWQALQDKFGGQFIKEDQGVDRKKLRQSIFSDPELKGTVDAILHPLIRDEVTRICEKGRVGNYPLTVVEVPLLYEAGWQDDFNQVIVVAANDETCLQRIMTRDKVSRREAEQAMAAQMDISTKVVLADHVIDNSGGWDDTAHQVEKLFRKLTVG